MVKLQTRARAMRVNGHRAAAANVDGQALLRVLPQLLDTEPASMRV